MVRKKDHPRFLGFLWKQHKFERRKDKLCTEKCIYCDREKHSPSDSDAKLQPDFIDQKKSSICNVVGKNYRKCKVCGILEYRGFSYGLEVPGYWGRWKKVEEAS